MIMYIVLPYYFDFFRVAGASHFLLFRLRENFVSGSYSYPYPYPYP